MESAGLVVRMGWAALAAGFAVLTVWTGSGALLAAAVFALCLGSARFLDKVPKLLFLVLVAMVPVDALTKLGGTLTFTKLLFPPAFALLLVDRVLTRRTLEWGRQGLLVAAFALSVALSFLLNEMGPFARHSLGRYAGVVLLFFLAVNVLESARDIRRLLWVVVASCVLSAGVGTLTPSGQGLGVGAALGPAAGMEHAGRLMGLSSVNPNTFASYLLVAAVIAAYFALADRRVAVRVLLLAAVLILGLGIVFSLSRAVSLVSAVTAGLLVIVARRFASPWRVAVVVLLVLACFVPLAPPEYLDRFRSLLTNAAVDRPFQSRLSFNRVGLSLLARNPVFGVGPGNFAARFTSLEFRFMADSFGPWKMLHNLYLAVACHMGLIGLALLGAIIARAFADLRYVVRHGPAGRADELTQTAEAVGVALISLLLNAFFLPAEHEKYIWVLFAVCAVLARLRHRQASGEASLSRAAAGDDAG